MAHAEPERRPLHVWPRPDRDVKGQPPSTSNDDDLSDGDVRTLGFRTTGLQHLLLDGDVRLSRRMPDAEELAKKIEVLRNQAAEARNRLVAIYGDDDPMDPRILVARHIRAVVGSAYLSAIFIDECLELPDWWRSHFREDHGGPISDEAASDQATYYWNFVTNGFVLFPFSLFEAGVRRAVRAIDAKACSGGTADFKDIYGWLLKRLGSDGWTYKNDATAFLDIYRSVRNTIHNNGYFYPRTGGDISFTWNGTQYDFIHGAVPSFTGWDFNLLIVRELVELNEAIMTAPLVSALRKIA